MCPRWWARVELETEQVVGRKVAWATSTTSVNADSDRNADEVEDQDEDLSSKESDKNDEFVREADDSSGNGSDESDDSDEFECQVQGNNRLDQYCENKDELQHDQQEEGLNHGHTNTQRKNHTPKPGPRNEPISWDDRIRDLYDFKETFGHCRVQQRFKDNPGLGRFVATMRSSKKRIKQGTYSGSVLTPARINELDELGLSGDKKIRLNIALSNWKHWKSYMVIFVSRRL